MHFLNNLQTNVQIQLAIIFELHPVVSSCAQRVVFLFPDAHINATAIAIRIIKSF
jgi:hypothetical protein